MKKKNIIWWIILMIGLIPFGFVLYYGIYNSIKGYSGFCLFECTLDYGISAFVDTLVVMSYIFWPAYLIGFVFIIIGIFKIIENKKMEKYKDL